MKTTMMKTKKQPKTMKKNLHFASAERPWMQFYPEHAQNMQIETCSLNEYLRKQCPGQDVVALDYYGTDVIWRDIFDSVDTAAKALKSLGFGIGDFIPAFLQSVPEYLILLLAAEKIGAALICRDGNADQYVEAIRDSGSEIIFEHDFFSKESETRFLKETQMKRAILISPYHLTPRSKMPEYIDSNIQSHYPENLADNPENMTWDEFMALGESFEGEYEAPVDPSRILYCPYTTGSTGDAKQVRHSAKNLIVVLEQMQVYTIPGPRVRWLHSILPPSLIAATVTMMLSPLSSDKLLILNPFCRPEDLDLELMRCKPNVVPGIPIFINSIVNSKRIPEDYDLSFWYGGSGGAEAQNNKQIMHIQEFMNKHHSHVVYGCGYGMTEAGAACTFPCPQVLHSNFDCCVGMPLPLTTISAFKPGTHEELPYNELGEICIHSPNLMIGYNNEADTRKVLQKHEDGKVWLHSGDMGYVTEQGLLYIMGRGITERFGGGHLFVLPMENRVAHIEGITDVFFVTIPDKDHPGYFLPYMYVMLEEGYTVDSIRASVLEQLEPHQYPVDIIELPERPYFHFKTNRKGLAAKLQGIAHIANS